MSKNGAGDARTRIEKRAWPRAAAMPADSREPNQGEIHFAIDVEIRAGLAGNHRNRLSRVIQNVAE